MPKNPEIFQPMTNLKSFVQMTDRYGVPCDVQHVRTFKDGSEMGVGYSLRDVGTWFVYDRNSAAMKWHKHCGPYSSFEQGAEWIRAIRGGSGVRKDGVSNR
jgi:hypothetical protein